MSVEEDAFKAEISELRKRVESLEQWAGNNSEQFTEKHEKTQSENETKDQQLVLTTDNLSEKIETESSDAILMDGQNDNFWEDD